MARTLAYVAAGAWALFAVTSLLVAIDVTTSGDEAIQRVIARASGDVAARASWLRPASFELARLGSLPVAVVVMAVVCLVFAVWRRTLWPAVVLGTSCLGVALTVGGLKDLYHRAEPYDALGALGFSFPSGHAAIAVAVWGGSALVIMLFLGRAPNRAEALLAVLSLAVALGVGAAMIARSAHWLSDVVGGIAAGVAWLTTVTAAVLVASVWRSARWRRSAEADVAVGAAKPVGVDEDERGDDEEDDAPAPTSQRPGDAHGRRHVPLG
jgi:membrane-associated phospholipid phosphatase